MADLAGRTALVTGAARRIGRAIATGLAARGVHCLVHYNRSEAEAAATLAELTRLGVRAEALGADLTDAAAVERLARAAADRGADLLVHNASAFSRSPFLETGIEAHRELLERDLAVHVVAPFLLGRVLGERMVERGFGRIVLFGDWSSGAAVYRHYASYIVSKAAVPTLAKVLALELGTRSAEVTVNAVLPGPILPPEGHDPADVQTVARQTILGRWVGTAEVVRAVVFLLESDQVTGTTLVVDAGRAVKAL